MTLRVDRLIISIATDRGEFGTEIDFGVGMTIIRASNTHGKSICLQAIAYALGLDLMFGPRGTAVLPHALISHLEDVRDHHEVSVLASEIRLTISNGEGGQVEIARPVVDNHRSTQLVAVKTLRGGGPDRPPGKVDEYFVGSVGSGSYGSERGFHRFLTSFVGWTLPEVAKYDGGSSPLYLETFFPLFYVEQKRGWSALQGHTPTFLRIRDVKKRATEFVLGMEYFERAARISAIERELERLRDEWSGHVRELEWVAQRLGLRVLGLPARVEETWTSSSLAVLVARETTWMDLERVTIELRNRLAGLAQPTYLSDAPEVERDLEAAEVELRDVQALLAVTTRELSAESARRRDADEYLGFVREDLRRHKDLRVLRNLGGAEAPIARLDGVCPTCGNDLPASLDTQHAHSEVRTIDEMIVLLEEQEVLARNVAADAHATAAGLAARVGGLRRASQAARRRIRSARNALVMPDSVPSALEVEARTELSARLDDLNAFEVELRDRSSDLEQLAGKAAGLRAELKALRSSPLSPSDLAKLARLGQLFSDQLGQYGFASLAPTEIEISQDSYQPTYAGFDVQFTQGRDSGLGVRAGRPDTAAASLAQDASASDGIRLIWAYVVGLLELAREENTNHSGMLILDEPRQQSTDLRDFQTLIVRLSTCGGFDQQVILATSEDAASVTRLTSGLDVHLVEFDRRILAFRG